MNYIYDILVNFNRYPYDFYDWNNNDPIEHIRKMPLFKISSDKFLELKNSEVVITEEWMEKIQNKTEVFQSKGVDKIAYAALFTDAMEVVAIEFNHQGKSIGKSRLLVDEESEVLEVADRIHHTILNYEVIKTDQVDNLKTRKELEISEYLHDQIKKLEHENVEKLRYLYYECFNKKEDDKYKIVKVIEKKLKEEWNSTYPQVYEFFKLTGVRK